MDRAASRCSNGAVRFEVDTKASPDQVRRALTDFSRRRLETWSRTLDPKRYEVLGQGDTWAVAREASPGSPAWVVARYDWSDPAVVRWTIEDSSYGGGGTGEVRIAPGPQGGTRVQVAWDYTNPTRQRPLLFVLRRSPMGRIIARMWMTALDRYAESAGG